MNASKEHPVLWWIGWIALTIVAFFIPCYAWTKFFAMHAGTMDKPGMPALWVTAVFGTWMIFLVPLIIVMYNKVDRAYEDARNARERQAKELLASSGHPLDVADEAFIDGPNTVFILGD